MSLYNPPGESWPRQLEPLTNFHRATWWVRSHSAPIPPTDVPGRCVRYHLPSPPPARRVAQSLLPTKPLPIPSIYCNPYTYTPIGRAGRTVGCLTTWQEAAESTNINSTQYKTTQGPLARYNQRPSSLPDSHLYPS
jgi:hypothetical protein